MVLYNVFVLVWDLTITQNSIHTISYLDRSRLTDTRSAENDRLEADTDTVYRIDASLKKTGRGEKPFHGTVYITPIVFA